MSKMPMAAGDPVDTAAPRSSPVCPAHPKPNQRNRSTSGTIQLTPVPSPDPPHIQGCANAPGAMPMFPYEDLATTDSTSDSPGLVFRPVQLFANATYSVENAQALSMLACLAQMQPRLQGEGMTDADEDTTQSENEDVPVTLHLPEPDPVCEEPAAERTKSGLVVKKKRFPRQVRTGSEDNNKKSGRRPRAPLFRYSKDDRNYLENIFKGNKYPTADEVAKLALVLDVPKGKVQTWFTNRRRRAGVTLAQERGVNKGRPAATSQGSGILPPKASNK